MHHICPQLKTIAWNVPIVYTNCEAQKFNEISPLNRFNLHLVVMLLAAAPRWQALLVMQCSAVARLSSRLLSCTIQSRSVRQVVR